MYQYTEKKQDSIQKKKLNSSQESLQMKRAIPNKTGIPDTLKSQFEKISGFSFDDVRVYYNSDKPTQLQAFAYTQGSQVHIAPGQEKHLEHELGHVVQQKQGIVKATTQINGVKINTDQALERDADKKLSGVFQRKKKTSAMIANLNQGIAQMSDRGRAERTEIADTMTVGKEMERAVLENQKINH